MSIPGPGRKIEAVIGTLRDGKYSGLCAPWKVIPVLPILDDAVKEEQNRSESDGGS